MFINSNIIENLINNKKLRLTQKNQKVNGENYFFNPQLNITLYNTRIIDIQEKFIIIEFDKDNLQGLKITNINKNIKEYIEKSINIENKKFYNLYTENDKKIRIRCLIPILNGMYKVEYIRDGNKTPFNNIYINSIINESEICIKNIWIKDDRIGFNVIIDKITQ